MQNPEWAAALLLLTGLSLRLLLLPLRWVNADEGAHLMDARLLLQGLVPVVDYASRQPLYTLVLAGFVKLFGVTLMAGRMLPLLASLGIAWMLFLFGRRLCHPRAGLLAAMLYLLLPYSLIWSTVVKTEMLAVFLCCLSAYTLLRGLSPGDGGWESLFTGGLIAGLATYVRQPAIYLAMAAVLFLLIYHPGKGHPRWRPLGIYLLGFTVTCIAVGLFYGRYWSLNQILFSQLNPLHLFWSRIGHVLGWLPENLRVVDGEGFRIFEQDPQYVIQAWRESILFSLFVLTAVLLLGWQWWKKHAGRRWRMACKNPLLLFALWPLWVILAYGFQTLSSTYYSQYFLEALPPLILLAAIFIHQLLERLRWEWIGTALIFWLGFFSLFLLFRFFWHWQWPVAAHFGMALLALVLYLFFTSRRFLKTWVLPVVTTALSLVTVALMYAHWPVALYVIIALCACWLVRFHFKGADQASLATLFFAALITASYSGAFIGPQYESSWSPQTVDQVVKILRQDGNGRDSVLSGAMIWTFASGLQPFSGVTHPTVFLKKHDSSFERVFEDARPAFIIVDGYTQKKFSRYWGFLQNELRRHYYLIAEIGGSRWPVKIYRASESPRMGDPPLAALPWDGERP